MSKRPTSEYSLVPVEQVPHTDMRHIVLDVIDENPFNPRRVVDAADLVDSVQMQGIIQPLLVRAVWKNADADAIRYQVIAGSRRLAAAKTAGLGSVPCLVRQLGDAEALEYALAENVKRQDMNPIDEALAYKTLIEQALGQGRERPYAHVAARIGQTEGHVYRRTRLLDLPPWLQKAVAEDRLTIAHAERLVRMSPAAREQAADPDLGVVWRRSPLLDEEASWVPSRDDLRPVTDLDAYARQKTHFDPTSTDVKFFQPELGLEIEKWEASLPADDPVLPTILELSENPFVRTQIGAAKGEPAPLTPAHWREISKAKDRCEFAQRGVITHGGPSRFLEVCITKKCRKHFPLAKKTKSGATPKPPKPADDWKERQAKETRERKAWDVLCKAAAPALVAHLRNVKFSAELVKLSLDAYQIQDIQKYYGVALTSKTAALVLALYAVDTYNRERFLKSVKPFKFNLGKVESKLAAEAKTAAKVEKAS